MSEVQLRKVIRFFNQNYKLFKETLIPKLQEGANHPPKQEQLIKLKKLAYFLKSNNIKWESVINEYTTTARRVLCETSTSRRFITPEEPSDHHIPFEHWSVNHLQRLVNVEYKDKHFAYYTSPSKNVFKFNPPISYKLGIVPRMISITGGAYKTKSCLSNFICHDTRGDHTFLIKTNAYRDTSTFADLSLVASEFIKNPVMSNGKPLLDTTLLVESGSFETLKAFNPWKSHENNINFYLDNVNSLFSPEEVIHFNMIWYQRFFKELIKSYEKSNYDFNRVNFVEVCDNTLNSIKYEDLCSQGGEVAELMMSIL